MVRKIYNIKLITRTIIIIVLAIIFYNILLWFIFEPAMEIIKMKHAKELVLIVCSFLTALIFPAGYYLGSLLGLCTIIIEIYVLSNVLKVAKSNLDRSYLYYYCFIFLMIVIVSFIGAILRKRVLLMLHNNNKLR